MKKFLIFACFILLFGCTSETIDYKEISAQTAMEMMDESVVILDVRSNEEYAEGHIKNAILLPLDEISTVNEVVDDVNKTILVYCRSGNRSKSASKQLHELGYLNVYDFGGIQDWPYEIVK